MSSRVLSYIRQPEYTGPNRCLPCTVVNVAIALVFAVAIGWFVPVAGVGFLVLALGTIALRGYLVPYTPELTAKYLPERIHRLFGHDTPEPPGDEAAIEELLINWGILEPCVDEDDICLREGVRERFRERLEAVRDDWIDYDAIATMFDADPDDIRLARGEPPTVVVHGSRSKWPSVPALMADAAMAEVLAADVPDWADTPLDRRGPLLAGLRPFLEACPGCDGPIELDDDEIYESCCRRKEVMRLQCTECEATVFEVDASHLEAVQGS